MSITMETAERWLAQEMEDMSAESEDLYQQREKLDRYDEMELSIFQDKQKVANSTAIARAGKMPKAEAKRKLSRKLYKKMAGIAPNQDIIAEVNRLSRHGKVSESTFYRYIDGM